MAEAAPAKSQFRPKWMLRLLKAWVRVQEVVHFNDLQVTLFWAGVIGFMGAVSSVLFRRATEVLHRLFTGNSGGYVASFMQLLWWQRILIPCVGGALAGITLLFASRFTRAKSSTDYMEAIVLGDGVLSSRVSLVKSLSALFSIASGASIGREGPLVQLSSMLASMVGRILGVTTLRLRLLVACGAAAGIASAYNAPIGGALFVAEIVLRSLSMESFGPLVFASVVATITTRQFLGGSPLYEIEMPTVQLMTGWQMIPYVGVGILAGFVAPPFLRLLRASERLFFKLPGPAFLHLALGGAVVGVLSIVCPEVCGNGASVVSGLLHGHYVWNVLVVILILKILATAATFGSGAVGGVFTPTLFIGACLGSLMAWAIQALWPGQAVFATGFTLVGMGAFLAATTHAPLMAILILFELTLDYQMVPPLMLACVVAHFVSRSFERESIYADSLKQKGVGDFQQQLTTMRVSQIMRKDSVTVAEAARFAEIAERFIANQFSYLYVVGGDNIFKGVISLHDIKGYLNDQNLASLVIAGDIMRPDFPTITPDAFMTDALNRFSQHDGERLPVIGRAGELLGSLSKSDVMLALAEAVTEEGREL